MIIGLSGHARAGKDTVAEILAGEGFTRVAFADLMKDALIQLNPLAGTYRLQEYVEVNGWEVAKVALPEVRVLLQRFGTEVGRNLFGENFWVDQLHRKYDLTNPNLNWVVSDVRFTNEAEDIINSGGKVLRVTRPGVGPVNSHVSDSGLANFNYNGLIDNSGDLETLRTLVLNTLNNLK